MTEQDKKEKLTNSWKRHNHNPSKRGNDTNTPYTANGREKLHKQLNHIILCQVRMALATPFDKESMEYNDNRIFRIAGQLAKCAIIKEYLGSNFHCHHIIPKSCGGTNRYDNLVLVSAQHTVLFMQQIQTL